MPTLKFENSLALENVTLSIVHEIVKEMKEKLKTVSADKKLNAELTKSLCKLTIKLVKATVKGDEPVLSKKQMELIDKEAIVLQAITEMFGELSTDEQSHLKDQIAFMIDNNLLKNKALLKQMKKKGLKFLKVVIGML
jgi:hypothetical protein